MEQEIKKINYLSASKIKTLDSCTWQYYCSYHLNIPQEKNNGAIRGTIVHNLFELISKEKHQHYIKKIHFAGCPSKVKEINKFLLNQFNKEGIQIGGEVKPTKAKYGKKNNWETVCDMVMTAIKAEFISKDFSKIIGSEHEFNIINENPRYAVRGFIDRIEEENEQTLKILDYKSSAKKFTGEDEDSNVQAMIYSLVARKIWKNYKNYKASFFFMRFPDDPYQNLEFSKDELDGLEHYLEYVSGILENFDQKKATSSMAAYSKEKNWLCQRGSWTCPFKNPLTFYKLKNTDGEFVSSHLKLDEAEQKIKTSAKPLELEIAEYKGCPAFYS
jgi:ATP-dependent helicase/DNAse subunit B